MSDTDPIDDNDTWFVLHCETDDSHVLVDDDSIISLAVCEVMLGEEVKFYYPGFKEPLTGVVKGKSGNVSFSFVLNLS